MLQAPTTGIYTGEAPEAPGAAPDASATGPETQEAAPQSPAATTPTSGEAMLPSESHEWQDNDGEARFTELPKKNNNRIYGGFELKPLGIEILGFDGGPHGKRHHVEFKLNAIEYAHSVVDGGKGPGGTVGIRYATRALGIADRATIAVWIRNRPTYLGTGAAGGGGVQHKRGEKIHQ